MSTCESRPIVHESARQTEHRIIGSWRVYGPWSDELALLHEQDEDVLTKKRDPLCRRVPINFIGALLLHNNQKRMLDILQAASGTTALPDRYRTPVYTVHDVPLFQYDSENRLQESLGNNAPTVLIKNICGHQVGLVVEGPFSGMLLDQTRTTNHPLFGMCINRLWNDEKIDYKTNPYPYLLNRVTSGGSRLVQRDTHPKLDGYELKSLLDRLFHTTDVDGHWSSQVILNLLSQYDDSLDLSSFSYTRPAVKDIE